MGFGNNLPDEFKEWYFDRQIKLVENIDLEDDQELLGQALHFYVDLAIKKQELKTGINIP